MRLECDVYICWASDVDDEYEFLYFSNGQAVRHFHQRDYYRTNIHVAIDSGEALDCENRIRILSQDRTWHGHNLILTIAESLGINLRHDQLSFEAYEIET